MGYHVEDEVLDHSEQSSAMQRLVLLILARAADENEALSFMYVETVARRACCAKRTVIRALEALENDGAVEVWQWFDKNTKHMRNVYRITVGRFAELRGQPPLGHSEIANRATLIRERARQNGQGDRESPGGEGDRESPGVRPGDTVTLGQVTESHPLRARDPIGRKSQEEEFPLEAASREPREAPEKDGSPRRETARDLVAEFVDACRAHGIETPRRTIGTVAQQTGQLLREGISPDAIRAGYRRMVGRGVMVPSALANFVAEASIPTGLRERRDGGLTPAQIIERTRGLP